MFGLEKMCLILLRYSNGLLFLCMVMGVRKKNKLKKKLSYLNMFGDGKWLTYFHAYG